MTGDVLLSAAASPESDGGRRVDPGRSAGTGIVVGLLLLVSLLAVSAAGWLVADSAAEWRAAQRALALSDAYQDASHAATVEQSLERSWRVARTPEGVALQQRAAETVTRALDRLAEIGADDAGTAAVLHDLHRTAWDAEARTRRGAAATESTSEDLQDLLSARAQETYATSTELRSGARIEVELLVLLAAASLLAAGAAFGVVVLRQRLAGRHVARLRSVAERMTLDDALTGLPNRVVLRDRLEQALLTSRREGTPMALLVIDLDCFKEINDALGHDYGDQLLAQVGPRLAGPLRASDTIARMGGDEFAVLLPRVVDVDAALLVAEKLQEALVEPFSVHGLELSVEASIGVVVSPDHGIDARVLLQRADIAMYVAKDGGLGVSAYDQALDGSSPARAALLGELRRAIDEGELALAYQPKCNAATGAVEGVEALVRWQHPERGLLLPAEFVPLAERTGLIHPLTRYVLTTALADCRRRLDQGVEIPVAVNLSARTLLDRGFASDVEQLLAYWGVPAGMLELEVTETALMVDPERACALLDRLADVGVVLAIDDFGTGYSSLASLRTLPVHDVKIDRSFVTTMLTSPNDAFIVRSVIALAHDVGLRVVAEGVEDAATHAALAELGCDVVQGYHLGQPVAADVLDRTVSAGRRISAPVRGPRRSILR